MFKIFDRIRVFCILLLAATSLLQAQMTPQEAIAQMTRGINVGRCLELSQGETPRYIEEQYFDDIVDARFNFVRIPVQWGWHAGTTAPYTVDSDFLDRVEQAVDWALARNLIVIINSHHDEYILYNADFTADDQARFEAIWAQAADRLQNKSDKLIFEIANEPIDLSISQVNQLNAAVIPILRASNPTRIIIYSGNSYTGLAQMQAAAIPNDPYIMATFHSYDPWLFAGEGTGTWGTTADQQDVANRFDEAAAWSQQHSIPVMLGEWGTVVENQYPTLIDTASRQLYLETYAKEASRTGVAPCIWNDFGWFGIYYPSNPAGSRWNYAKDIIMANTNPATLAPTVSITYPPGEAELRAGAIVINATASDSDGSVTTVEFYNGSNYLGQDTTPPYTVEWASVSDGCYTITAKAIDDIGASSTDSVNITVGTGCGQLPYGGSPSAIPGHIEAEDFDLGGEGVAYHDTDTGNTGNQYRTLEDVDIEICSEGGYNTGWTDPGEWLEYTVDVAAAGNYTIDIRVASETSGGTFHIEFNGADKTGHVTVPVTGGWQTWMTVSATATLPAGKQIMRFVSGSSGYNVNSFDISANFFIPDCDIDNNGFYFDMEDLLKMAQNWLSAGPVGDANASGRVDFIDFSECAKYWGD